MKGNNNYTKTEYVVNGLRVTDLRLVGDHIEENNLTEINSFVNINGVRTEVITPSNTVTEPYNTLDMDDFNEDGTIKADVLTGQNNNNTNTFIKA